MKLQAREIVEQNAAMRREIAAKGLRLEDVWSPSPHDPESENRRLSALLNWMRAYLACPSRRHLELMGYQFPPVEPDFDPDTDWMRFERWINREPISWRFEDTFGHIADPADLTDAQVSAEIARVRDLLLRRSVCVDVSDRIPERLLLQHLREFLRTASFDFAGAGSCWHLDGCDGCCPECFQRPWCEAGLSSCWLEDERAGQMVVPPNTCPFVTGTVSLQQLQDAEAGWI